ncbi:MAG: hypothetical protein MHM6MM_005023 [Cercozoa sp. M6MM]
MSAVREEVSAMWRLAWPTIAVRVLLYLQVLWPSIMVGHALGKDAYAAVALAFSLVNVTGLSVGFGLNAAVDSLVGKANGAGRPRQAALALTRALCVSLFAALPISLVWLFAAPSLMSISLHEDDVVRMGAHFMRVCVPALPPAFAFDALARFLAAHGEVRVQLLLAFVSNLFSLVVSAVVVLALDWGVTGAALATVSVEWTQFLLAVAVIRYRQLCRPAWPAVTRRKFWAKVLQGRRLLAVVKLALSGLVMVVAEWWAFEVAIVLSGRFGEVELAAYSTCQNVVALLFMLTYGMAIAASTRVSNALGAKNAAAAKSASKTALMLSVCVATFNISLLVLGRRLLARAFTSDAEVVERAMKLLLPLCILQLGDVLQGVASGIVRGAGMLRMGSYVNVVGYWIIALPLGSLLAFHFDWKGTGLLVGLSVGALLCSSVFCVTLWRTDWTVAASAASTKVAGEDEHIQVDYADLDDSDDDYDSPRDASDVDLDDLVSRELDRMLPPDAVESEDSKFRIADEDDFA